jgi:hypothetical protein
MLSSVGSRVRCTKLHVTLAPAEVSALSTQERAYTPTGLPDQL